MNKILKSKSKRTGTLLTKIATIIMREVPSETHFNYYQFLVGTKDVDDNVMEYAIEQYYQGKWYLNGKGFPYLRTIALNRGKNIKAIKENERKRLGSVPPVYKGEEE
tara:strand:+ start:1649 stop:1969 length:321 start_codon:yes stop_codon:yes gene_type:complete